MGGVGWSAGDSGVGASARAGSMGGDSVGGGPPSEPGERAAAGAGSPDDVVGGG